MSNKNASSLDLEGLYRKGLDMAAATKQVGEDLKVGTLRGGNTGCLAMNQAVGSCPRLSYLRSKGIEVEATEFEDSLMFSLGFLNEDDWVQHLRLSWPGVIKQEEEISVGWKTVNGTLVTGRPDIVLCESDATPVLGIELKQICSLWTAKDAGIKLEPKTKHLCQAAHYSWQLGKLPYRLVYTSRVNFAVPNVTWAQALFPKPDEVKDTPLEGRLKYKTSDTKKGVQTYLKDILPFVQVYDLEWNKHDQLVVTPVWQDLRGRSVTTLITVDGIRNYYEGISRAEETGVLPMISQLTSLGGKASYKECDYCVLASTCSSAKFKGDKIDVAAWTSAAQTQIAASQTKLGQSL